MIVLTGAAGFIGGYVASKFNAYGIRDLILSDDFSNPAKLINHTGRCCIAKIHRDELVNVLERDYAGKIETVIHLGARTDTTEMDSALLYRMNTGYSKTLWNYCTRNRINFIYASSAATYGSGENGYSDDVKPEALKPLNPYGESKNQFDLWALGQTETPPYFCGLKFFNVYGPGEGHKGRMASVVFHAYRQITETGKLKLFRSHKEGIADGEQKRDFIYVDDVAEMIWYIYKRHPRNGLLNIGTGEARSFLDLGKAVFAAMDKEPDIEFIDIPADIRDTYQYFTRADIKNLKATGYMRAFTSLEEGVSRYVQTFLKEGKPYLGCSKKECTCGNPFVG
jgi:ADP-L-glycero-D-manno-heptose 6-epimerase